jgi:hypothetical protein
MSSAISISPKRKNRTPDVEVLAITLPERHKPEPYQLGTTPQFRMANGPDLYQPGATPEFRRPTARTYTSLGQSLSSGGPTARPIPAWGNAPGNRPQE